MKRNTFVAIYLGAWFLLAVVVFSWLHVQSKQFQVQWQDYSTALAARLAQADEALGKYAATNDQTAQRDTLTKLAADLSEPLPVPPNVLGVSLGADRERQQHAAVSRAIPQYVDNLHQTAHFLEYQENVAIQLRPLALLAAGSEEKLRSLAGVWQQKASTLNDMIVPHVLAEPHLTLVTCLKNGQQHIARLAELYKANDTSGFATEYDLLRAETACIRTVSAQITHVAATLDQQRAELRVAIRQNM